MKKIFNAAEMLFGLVFLFYFAFLNRSGARLDFAYLWAAAGSIFFLKGAIFAVAGKIKKRMTKIFSSAFNAVFAVYILTASVFYICVFGSMALTAPAGCDCVVVLGAAVVYDEPSDMLRDRIDAAYEYLAANPDADVICTGGKSTEDIVSEGGCIADALINMGIDESRIIREEQSSTTVENIRFSMDYLLKYDSAAVVTSGFHLFRGKCILRALTPLKVYGISSSGISAFTPHYIMREYVAFAVDLFRGGYKV